jgi:UDP-xylose/UDP-N-acetylglucosamine transporter B4
VVITVGIVLATISAPRRRSPTPKPLDTHTSTTSLTSTDYLSENMQYAAGILVLATALFMSACLGIFQEETYRKYGKQWREGLFYCVRPLNFR